MAKPSEVIKDAVKELQAAIKELKDGDEEDLGELANKLYAVSERADTAANLLEKANQALEGGSDQEDEQPEEPNQPEDQSQEGKDQAAE